MTEIEFWNYIQSSVDKTYADDEKLLEDLDEFGHYEVQSMAIKGLLKKKGVEEAVAFQRMMGKKIFQLYQSHIAEIFLLCAYQVKLGKRRYFSTDGFIDFRAWIVGLGEKAFNDYLKLKTEDDILNPLMTPDVNYSDREDLVYIGVEVCNELDNTVKVDYYFDGDYDELNDTIDWNKLDEKYPKLWKLFQLENENE